MSSVILDAIEFQSIRQDNKVTDRRKSATREQSATIKVAHAQQQRVAAQRLAAPVDG